MSEETEITVSITELVQLAMSELVKLGEAKQPGCKSIRVLIRPESDRELEVEN